MTILNTPPIKLTDIRDAYGEAGTIVLTDYYRDGGIVTANSEIFGPYYYTDTDHEYLVWDTGSTLYYYWDGYQDSTGASSLTVGNLTMYQDVWSGYDGHYLIRGKYWYNQGVPYSGNITILDFQGVSGNP